MDKESLMRYGIDLDKGLKNCMGNLPFYKKILSMFLKDPCFEIARKAYAEKNAKELFGRMHELKGISGNAALFKLYEASVPLVELLRHGEGFERGAELDKLFSAAEAAYVSACEGVALFIEEP